ncbi:hypothetical protein DVJ77_03585 [Dyella tabacisoli]|uniref:Uncharacterized protein n=1 Tax=Dyella tabacisoli TaxID=2282381 RepID=A0A369UT67_9GAMM|nr:hypothetical protein DVJ77_03585 [Dyella tabacisoli]
MGGKLHSIAGGRWGTGNGERGTGNGERGTGNGEKPKKQKQKSKSKNKQKSKKNADLQYPLELHVPHSPFPVPRLKKNAASQPLLKPHVPRSPFPVPRSTPTLPDYGHSRSRPACHRALSRRSGRPRPPAAERRSTVE